MTYLQMPQYHTTHMLSGHCEMVCKSITFERQEKPCCQIYVALAMTSSWENGWATVGMSQSETSSSYSHFVSNKK